jgi:signal transduction histidine kinase
LFCALHGCLGAAFSASALVLFAVAQQSAHSLSTIDRQVRKLARLVEQLLGVGRIDAKRLKLGLHVTDVTSIVWNVVIDAAARTILHEFIVDIPIVLTASVDPLRFERVVTNLVDNAIKFSPRGGQIQIAAAISDGAVRVSIRDHGIGVPLVHRMRIFERSYLVHAGHAAGLGLGLHISREIIEQHAGTLALECPMDGGSRCPQRTTFRNLHRQEVPPRSHCSGRQRGQS